MMDELKNMQILIRKKNICIFSMVFFFSFHTISIPFVQASQAEQNNIRSAQEITERFISLVEKQKWNTLQGSIKRNIAIESAQENPDEDFLKSAHLFESFLHFKDQKKQNLEDLFKRWFSEKSETHPNHWSQKLKVFEESSIGQVYEVAESTIVKQRALAQNRDSAQGFLTQTTERMNESVGSELFVSGLDYLFSKDFSGFKDELRSYRWEVQRNAVHQAVMTEIELLSFQDSRMPEIDHEKIISRWKEKYCNPSHMPLDPVKQIEGVAQVDNRKYLNECLSIINMASRLLANIEPTDIVVASKAINEPLEQANGNLVEMWGDQEAASEIYGSYDMNMKKVFQASSLASILLSDTFRVHQDRKIISFLPSKEEKENMGGGAHFAQWIDGQISGYNSLARLNPNKEKDLKKIQTYSKAFKSVYSYQQVANPKHFESSGFGINFNYQHGLIDYVTPEGFQNIQRALNESIETTSEGFDAMIESIAGYSDHHVLETLLSKYPTAGVQALEDKPEMLGVTWVLLANSFYSNYKEKKIWETVNTVLLVAGIGCLIVLAFTGIGTALGGSIVYNISVAQLTYVSGLAVTGGVALGVVDVITSNMMHRRSKKELDDYVQAYFLGLNIGFDAAKISQLTTNKNITMAMVWVAWLFTAFDFGLGSLVLRIAGVKSATKQVVKQTNRIAVDASTEVIPQGERLAAVNGANQQANFAAILDNHTPTHQGALDAHIDGRIYDGPVGEQSITLQWQRSHERETLEVVSETSPPRSIGEDIVRQVDNESVVVNREVQEREYRDILEENIRSTENETTAAQRAMRDQNVNIGADSPGRVNMPEYVRPDVVKQVNLVKQESAYFKNLSREQQVLYDFQFKKLSDEIAKVGSLLSGAGDPHRIVYKTLKKWDKFLGETDGSVRYMQEMGEGDEVGYYLVQRKQFFFEEYEHLLVGNQQPVDELFEVLFGHYLL